MKKVRIVIGANWGDEGKGLMTDYYASKAKENNETCLVVCHNGGAQKGHTVKTIDGERHVFHHFGAGAFEGALTYLAKTYIVNPYIFNNEYKELISKKATVTTYLNENSLLSTPFDILINQIIENSRGLNRHGSCGVGIFETVTRSKINKITIKKFLENSDTTKFAILDEIRKYYVPYRLKNLGIEDISDRFKEILSNDNVIYNFISDFNEMIQKVTICTDDILEKFDCIIFEGAQGLALDQNNTKYMPNLTPSSTDSTNPCNILANFNLNNVDIETCYITRTYFTRHGAGILPSECKKTNINKNIIDLTNVPNEYQETIRYGYFDVNDIMERINKDLKHYNKINTRKCILVTHLNYTENKLKTKEGFLDIKFAPDFEYYVSDSETCNSVKKG